MTELALTTFVTLFVIIDPVGIVSPFIGLTPRLPAAALDAVIIAAGVLIAVGPDGGWLLPAMSLRLPVFRIAGGIRQLPAIDMVTARPPGRRTLTAREGGESSRAAAVTVFPPGSRWRFR